MSDDDTKPLPLEELNTILGVNDAEVSDAKKRLPDASAMRAAVVGGLLFAGAVIGKPELGHEVWIDSLMSAYVVVAPLALAWWIHRKHPKAPSPLVADSHGRHEKP